MTDETARLLIVELAKVTSAVTQLTSVMSTMAHDVRATREKVNVIEARTPYPRRRKAASG